MGVPTPREIVSQTHTHTRPKAQNGEATERSLAKIPESAIRKPDEWHFGVVFGEGFTSHLH